MPSICAVIVTFRPERSLIRNIQALLPQVAEIVLVDNGTDGQPRRLLDETATLPGVRLLAQPTNLGVAAALNIGVRYALEAGYDWVATFDQDSLVTPHYMETMLLAYESCGFREQVALVSPVYQDQSTGLIRSNYGRGRSPGGDYRTLENSITSGSLVKSGAFQEAGFFEEALFIDYVDTEFSLRLQSRGFAIIEACRALLHHNLGRCTRHSFLGRPVITTNHDAARRYYKTRNRVVIYRRYFRRFPLFVARDLLKLGKDMIKIVAYEQNATGKLSAMARGARHGLTGRMDLGAAG